MAQALRGRGRRGDHLHRHRPRRRARRHQLGRDAEARARRDHAGDRLGRPRLDGRHRAAEPARMPDPRRRHLRPRALRRAHRAGSGAGAAAQDGGVSGVAATPPRFPWLAYWLLLAVIVVIGMLPFITLLRLDRHRRRLWLHHQLKVRSTPA